MKADSFVGLENAAWPVLLVDSTCTVRRANTAALTRFGVALEGGPSLQEAVWSSENDQNAREFLLRQDRSASVAIPLRFRVKGGGNATFLTYICAHPKEGEKQYLFQLFAPTAGTVDTPPPAPVPGAAESLVQKQKLDCALQLTRTVALDFNNALTSILGHTSLVLSKMPPDHPWRGSLREVEKSAEKAAEIANDLASFSRQERDTPAQAAGNLNNLLQRTVALFKPAHANVEWSFQLERQVYSVKFDEAKMQQAFVKIIENSLQAVGAKAPRIQVRSRNVILSEALDDGVAHVPAGNYVCVEIEDNGEGIAPQALPRIFEPFFTTKKSPAHRGLGLAWVYGIVTNHGGSVAVSSRLGEGAAVRVYLPAQQRFVKDQTLTSDNLSGHQTVLIVDDEDLVLTMGETILTAYGYKVLTANCGAKALAIVAEHPGRVDLVVTDLVMPQMSGRELIDHLRVLAPQVRIICASGYMRHPGQEGDVGYLKKPFTSQDLLRKVKQALE